MAVWLNRSRLPTRLGWTALGFAAPLVMALVYLRNAGVFLADPLDGAGVFRGGGSALTFDPPLMAQTVARLLGDLVFCGTTYYFAIPRAEFSGVVGLAAAAGLILGGVAIASKRTPVRHPLALAALLCAASIAAVAVTLKLPGLRRGTGFVSGFYVAVACAWVAPILSGGVNRLVGVMTKLACLLLVLHHVVVYRVNYRYVKSETAAMHDPWLSRAGPPDRSIAMWAREWTLNGRPLDCRTLGGCRYTEIYSAVARVSEMERTWRAAGAGNRSGHRTTDYAVAAISRASAGRTVGAAAIAAGRGRRDRRSTTNAASTPMTRSATPTRNRGGS